MKYLVDTQVFLWSLGYGYKLPNHVKEIITNYNNEIYLSYASIWEVVIKNSLGKLKLPFDIKHLPSAVQEMSFQLLQIKIEHLLNLKDMDYHHKDPFDRLIISQSIIEKLPIITSDKQFKNYNAEIIEVI